MSGYRRTHRWIRAALLAVILLASALRLWQLPVLPPGLSWDEAINGIDARMVLSGAGLPLYFTANNGREPLFIYLQTLSVAIFGSTPYALRLVSAFLGILTIPALYFCATTLLRPVKTDSPEDGAEHHPGMSSPEDYRDEARLAGWTALLTATGLAISYWHLSLSRLGLRAVMLPLVSALAIAWFWRGWTKNRRRDYALSGAWFGIALYTYTAARFLPVVALLFVLCEAILDAWRARHQATGTRSGWCQVWQQRLVGLGLQVGICVVVAAPLGFAAWRDPYTVLGRAAQVSVSGVSQGQAEVAPSSLIENLVRVARSFYDRGDQNLRHNLPGRPVNDPLLALLFTLGWLTALLKLRQAPHRLLLIWLVVMLLPTILATPAPHSLRSAGALPPLALLCAVGARSLLRLVSQVWNRSGKRPGALRRQGAPILILAVVLISGSLTVRDYFLRWARSPDLGQAFDLQRQLAAETASKHLMEASVGEPLLLSDELYTQPQMVFVLGVPPEVALPTSWVPAGHPAGSRFLLEDGFDPRQPMSLLWQELSGPVFAALEPLSAEDAQQLGQATEAPRSEMIRAPLHQDGWPRLLAGALPESVLLQPRRIQTSLNVRFANGIRLVGYEVQPDWQAPAAAKHDVRLTLFWRLDEDADRPAAQASSAFVHLANQDGVWADANGAVRGRYFYSWPRLQRTIEDSRILHPPEDMPNGKAFFEVGLFRTDLTGSDLKVRTDILDDQSRVVGDRVELGAIMIGQPPPKADLSDLQPASARFDDRIELVGWRVDRDPAQPDGQIVRVDLGWRALARSTTDYTAFVHLVREDNNDQIVAQHDEAPGGVANPTTRWVPGETVRLTFVLQLPSGVPPDALRLRVGIYEPVSGKRLMVASPEEDAAGTSGGTFLDLPLHGS